MRTNEISDPAVNWMTRTLVTPPTCARGCGVAWSWRAAVLTAHGRACRVAEPGPPGTAHRTTSGRVVTLRSGAR
jgi:hypothetical protein